MTRMGGEIPAPGTESPLHSNSGGASSAAVWSGYRRLKSSKSSVSNLPTLISAISTCGHTFRQRLGGPPLGRRLLFLLAANQGKNIMKGKTKVDIDEGDGDDDDSEKALEKKLGRVYWCFVFVSRASRDFMPSGTTQASPPRLASAGPMPGSSLSHADRYVSGVVQGKHDRFGERASDGVSRDFEGIECSACQSFPASASFLKGSRALNVARLVPRQEFRSRMSFVP